MNRKNLLLLWLTALISCKNDIKSTEASNENNGKANSAFMDDQVEEALYNGYFIKSENGFDVALKDNTLFLFKKNDLTNAEKNNHFFLHVLPKNAPMINMDFAPTEFKYNDKLSANFSKITVYKRELPAMVGSYDLNIGQFNTENRTWEIYIQVDNLNKVDNTYRNEYTQNNENNRYLKRFESAFNEGYFMKNQEGYDLLLNGHTLYYIKPNGTNADLKDMFFLHIKYEGSEEIHNLDFKGEGYKINELLGSKFQNFSIIERTIPDLGKITEVDTGQFDINSRSWSVLYDIDKLYNDKNFIYNDQYREFLQGSGNK